MRNKILFFLIVIPFLLLGKHKPSTNDLSYTTVRDTLNKSEIYSTVIEDEPHEMKFISEGLNCNYTLALGYNYFSPYPNDKYSESLSTGFGVIAGRFGLKQNFKFQKGYLKYIVLNYFINVDTDMGISTQEHSSFYQFSVNAGIGILFFDMFGLNIKRYLFDRTHVENKSYSIDIERSPLFSANYNSSNKYIIGYEIKLPITNDVSLTGRYEALASTSKVMNNYNGYKFLSDNKYSNIQLGISLKDKNFFGIFNRINISIDNNKGTSLNTNKTTYSNGKYLVGISGNFKK